MEKWHFEAFQIIILKPTENFITATSKLLIILSQC